MSPIHVKELKGCSVAVDTYSWLCKGLPTSRHIEYCIRHYGVKPVLIFDANEGRTNVQGVGRKILRALLSMIQAAAAFGCYQKAVDISPLIAHELIQGGNAESSGKSAAAFA